MSKVDGKPQGADLPEPERLAEILLDAAAIGEFERELARVRASIARQTDKLDANDLARYRVLLFDLALVSTTNRVLQTDVGIDMLADANESAWDVILGSSRIDDIRRLSGETSTGLELLELLTYSPDTGTRDFAISGLEATGMRLLANGESSRSIERLLHVSGASEAAYRLEAARKQRVPHQPSGDGRRGDAATQFPYRAIAIAGGHAQLRVAAAALFEPYGVSVVSIPSSREAVRRERDILHLLRGCDLALVLVRQITHSTSDQVRAAADKLGVPVMFSNALSAVAIERQLLEQLR